MRLLRHAQRKARAIRDIARALASTAHPLLVHIVPIRRCNIDCGYCNEYDKVSASVPLSIMLARLDHLASLGTSIVTCSGGEPLLHPDIDAIVGGIRERGMTAGLITNGYLLSPSRIASLNEAGLDYLQISIDNLVPDEVSKKSLKVLDRKLQWLRDGAEFDVNINSVLGAGIKNPEDARTITARALSLGFSASVGILHDGTGRLRPLGPRERTVYDEVSGLISRGRSALKNLYSGIRTFQENLAEGRPNEWRCRAGARYLYVCENGLVHYCSQQRGYPAIPLEQYSKDDLRREFRNPKACAPFCTVGCVHRISLVDAWRAPQRLEPLPHEGRNPPAGDPPPRPRRVIPLLDPDRPLAAGE